MNNKITIGILGGGQLARMSAYQAYKLGLNVAILEKIKNSPAGQLTQKEFVGWVDDKDIFDEFADACDIITLENEFVDFHFLQYLENKGKKVIPSSKTISLIQDKLIQKETLLKKGIPVAKFINIDHSTSYEKCSTQLGNKFIIKSRKFGYDGYGNYLVENENDFQIGINKLSNRHSDLYAEEFIQFQKELAIIVVRSKKETITYPVVETIQKNHICYTVIAPSSISKNIVSNIKTLAIESVEAVKGYGIYGIEFFLTKENKVLVNEMAPRPHNTGHYTIEGCVTSQFENHVRSILNLPLGSTKMVSKYAVMVNLLGKTNDLPFPKNINEALNEPDVHLHLYGKEKSRIGRKMGHITLIGDNLKRILKKTVTLEKKLIY